MRARDDVKSVIASWDLGLGHLVSIIRGDKNEVPRIASRHLLCACRQTSFLPSTRL